MSTSVINQLTSCTKMATRVWKLAGMLSAVILSAACVRQTTGGPTATVKPVVTVNGPGNTATVSSAFTKEPLPATAVAFPINTPTAPPDSILPSLAIGIGLDDSAFVCASDAQGQVRVSNSPFLTTTVVVAEKNASYSQPSWSPNNKWLAFIKSEHDTDSVWVIHPDGSDPHRISDELPRQEVTASGSCEPNAGIYSLAGWSPDSHWLTFFYKYLKAGTTSKQNDWYLVDVEHQQTQLLIENIQPPLSPTWSPDSSRLLFAENSPRTDWRLPTSTEKIASLKLEEGRVLVADAVPLPPQLADSFGVEALVGDNSALYASLYDTAYRPLRDSPSVLWRYDLQAAVWQQMAQLGPTSQVIASYEVGAIASCQEKSAGRIEVRVFDLNSEGTATTTQLNGVCNLTRLLKNEVDGKFVSSVAPTLGYEIWVQPTNGNAAPRQIPIGTTLGFAAGSRILSLSWATVP